MTHGAANAAPRVLVIYKKTAFQRTGRRARVQRLLADSDPSVARMMDAHTQHLETLGLAKQALADLGAKATFRHRHQQTDRRWDLVVTLGGDGTLLWASHMVGRGTPMVAINSAPEHSVGYFCAGERKNVHETLEQALAGSLRESSLTRMRVRVDDVTVSTRVLNDVLFCHSCPAATSRYILRSGGREEEQTSSGVWIGPAAGSTAAQHSAGGRVLALGSTRLQYVVREPYCGPGARLALTRGLVRPGARLELRSKMREGMLFVDGAHRTHGVDIGAVLRLDRSDEPLTLLGIRHR
ncbi:MAG: NAD(+) kinase [Deltaproteobacteria bacterium]|nr:NAD(+) kinase [Deltaproteobacteria bacterium]